MEKKDNSRLKILRKFSFSFSLGMFFLSLVMYFHYNLSIFALIFFLLSLFHLLSGFFYPKLSIATNRVVFFIGLLLSNIMFVLFYYLIFTPIAVILRISGKDIISNKYFHTSFIERKKQLYDQVKKMY